MCTALASTAEEHVGHMAARLPTRDKKSGINLSESLPSHQQNCLITNMLLWNIVAGDWIAVLSTLLEKKVNYMSLGESSKIVCSVTLLNM